MENFSAIRQVLRVLATEHTVPLRRNVYACLHICVRLNVVFNTTSYVRLPTEFENSSNIGHTYTCKYIRIICVYIFLCTRILVCITLLFALILS